MFAVSSVRSLSNFWNRAKWDFLMQNEAIQFWIWVCGKFLSLWPNVYYWWTNICWTTSWQIFCRLIAANKYLALRMISPTNDAQVKIFEYNGIFFGEKKISLQLLHHHTCLSILSMYYSLKIRSLLSYPRQNVQTRHGWFLQQRIFTNGKYLQKDKIPHVSEDWKINLQVKERGLNFEERSGGLVVQRK